MRRIFWWTVRGCSRKGFLSTSASTLLEMEMGWGCDGRHRIGVVWGCRCVVCVKICGAYL